MAEAPKPTARIRMPSTARAGDVVEVKTLISHDMESGLRKDVQGQPVARKIIKEFTVSFDGALILRAEWFTAVSANPYQSFFVRVPRSGTFVFTWLDDDGSIYKAEQKVVVD